MSTLNGRRLAVENDRTRAEEHANFECSMQLKKENLKMFDGTSVVGREEETENRVGWLVGSCGAPIYTTRSRGSVP